MFNNKNRRTFPNEKSSHYKLIKCIYQDFYTLYFISFTKYTIYKQFLCLYFLAHRTFSIPLFVPPSGSSLMVFLHVQGWVQVMRIGHSKQVLGLSRNQLSIYNAPNLFDIKSYFDLLAELQFHCLISLCHMLKTASSL